MKFLTTTLAILLGLLVATYLWIDLTYILFGNTTEGVVTRYSIKVADFDHTQMEGGHPKVQGDFAYSFRVGNETFAGKCSNLSARAVGDSVQVQFISHSPERNRLLDLHTQAFRLLFWSCPLLAIAYVVKRQRTGVGRRPSKRT